MFHTDTATALYTYIFSVTVLLHENHWSITHWIISNISIGQQALYTECLICETHFMSSSKKNETGEIRKKKWLEALMAKAAMAFKDEQISED